MIRYRVISPYIKYDDSGYILLTKESAQSVVESLLSENNILKDVVEQPAGVWSDNTTNSIHAQLIPMVFSDKYNLTSNNEIIVAFASAQPILNMFPSKITARSIENGYEIEHAGETYKMLESKKSGVDLIDLIINNQGLPTDNWVLNGYAITQNRERDYGHPLANFLRIALRDNIREAGKLAAGKYYTPIDVALRNIDQKLAREQNPNAPINDDNYIDIVGYTNTIVLMNMKMKSLGYNGVDDLETMNIQDMFDLLLKCERDSE